MNFLPAADPNLHPHWVYEGDQNGVLFHHETVKKRGWDGGLMDGILLPFQPGKSDGGTHREQQQASSRSRRKGNYLLNDRRRRHRISERIVALQQLVPNSKRGGPSSALDEITSYIQHLQLQLEDLSRSKLGAKAGPGKNPLSSHRGLDLGAALMETDKTPADWSGEVMGKLMEERPLLARKLLENKGLFLVPTTLAQEFGSVGGSSSSIL